MWLPISRTTSSFIRSDVSQVLNSGLQVEYHGAGISTREPSTINFCSYISNMATPCGSLLPSCLSPVIPHGRLFTDNGPSKWARILSFLFTHLPVRKVSENFAHLGQQIKCTRAFRAESEVLDILVADRETHIRQRRLLSHAFSEKALREQESILQLYVSKLMEQLSTRWSSGPLNMVAWYNFTSKSTRKDWLSIGQLMPYCSI